MIEAVVLAGGFGTRLRSVVPDLPKPMAPIRGRPFLELLLTALAAKGVRRAVLSLGYKADLIRAHFGSAFADIDLAYRVETVALGTGGAMRYALGACESQQVLVVNGDTFLDLELDALRAAWGGDPIIVGREVPDCSRYGRIEHAGGRVTGFAEKGATGPGVINSGHYLLPADAFAGCALADPFSFESDFLPDAVHARRHALFLSHGSFIDIGVPDDYARAQVELA